MKAGDYYEEAMVQERKGRRKKRNVTKNRKLRKKNFFVMSNNLKIVT